MLHIHYTRGQNYSKAFLNYVAKSSGICSTFCQPLLDVFTMTVNSNYQKSADF